MKTIWARVGVSLEVSDEEYEALKEQRDTNGDVTVLECESDLSARFIWYGYPDGEIYIPSVVFDEIDGEENQ